MGDSPYKEIPEKSTTTTPDDIVLRLQDDAYRSLRKPDTDKIDKNTSANKLPVPSNPYLHLKAVGTALQELNELKSKNNDEKIAISDGTSQSKSITVSERRAQLIARCNSEYNAAIIAADLIDQSKANNKLIQTDHDLKAASHPQVREQLQELESSYQSMKDAPSIARFSYATFLADQGDLIKAKKYLNEAAQINPEATLDKAFKQVSDAVDIGLKAQEDNSRLNENPLATLLSADNKRKNGDVTGAEADYKLSVTQAERLSPDLITSQLSEIEEAKKASSTDPKALSELQVYEEGWISLAHAQAITKINYAEFLIEQKRYKEAMPLLIKAAQADPELVKDNSDFQKLAETARNEGKTPKRFDNPFDHLSNFEQAVKAKDFNLARKELEASVRAADKIDRRLMQHNKRVIQEQLNEETDKTKRQDLIETHKAYDALDHASAATRVALARFEIANKNYNKAQALLTDTERFDPELAKRPDIEMDKLKELAQEPSAWQKVWSFTKDVVEDLVCDATAVLAGVGAGLGVGALTSLSGPGAVAAGTASGTAAGSAAYTFMKCVVFGNDFEWSMPLWGALDGASGGMAAMARTALVRVGGRIVSEELAEATVLKTGGRVAALNGLDGLRLAHTAQVLSHEGLKSMGKNLTRMTRITSNLPFLHAGDIEYRAALNAYRRLKYTNLMVKAGIDGGTALAGASIYRLGKEGYKYANGEYDSFSDFAEAYGLSVLKDTTAGVSAGAFSLGFGNGMLVSGVTSGLKEGLSGNNHNLADFTATWIQSIGTDAFLGTTNWLLGSSASKLAASLPGLHSTLTGLWQGSIPRWADVNAAKDSLARAEATLTELKRPVKGKEELSKRLYYIPGNYRL